MAPGLPSAPRNPQTARNVTTVVRTSPEVAPLPGWTDVIEKLLLKFRARDDVSAEEEAALRGCIAETRLIRADETVVREGELLDFSTLLISGLMCRFKDLASGARQVTELHIAGDFADLHSFTLKRLEHSVMALTPCEIGIAPHEGLRLPLHQ